MRRCLADASKLPRYQSGNALRSTAQESNQTVRFWKAAAGFGGILEILDQTFADSSDDYREWLTDLYVAWRVSGLPWQTAAAFEPGCPG